MSRFNTKQRMTASMVMVIFACACILAAPAKAAMIDTATAVKAAADDQLRQKVVAFFDRQDVRDQMVKWGVDPELAKQRVALLSDEEVRALSDRIDKMPAGGDALGFIVALAIILFVVLLITDMLGITDVFTFVKKRR